MQGRAIWNPVYSEHGSSLVELHCKVISASEETCRRALSPLRMKEQWQRLLEAGLENSLAAGSISPLL